MQLILFFLFYLASFSEVLVKQIEVKCPSHCICDYWMTFKRATCTNKSLAGIDSELPQQTEILDLSYNQISHFSDHIFLEQNLTALKLLNVSHNKLGQIHWRAFEGLNQLKTVDFSYNAIQYLRSSWLSHLPILEELYLRANSFTKIDNGPIFVSNTLKILDLSQCTITHLGQDVFQLPQLEILDLSENYLIHLDVETVQPLPSLTMLMVHNNTFSCDSDMSKLVKYCLERGIRFENPCRIKDSGSEKFQRIVNMAEPEEPRNLWIYDEDETTVGVNVTGTTQNCSKTSTDRGLLRDIIDLSPTLAILIPFIYGIAVGILIGCTVQIRGKIKKFNDSNYINFEDQDNNLTRTRRYSRRISKSSTPEERVNLPMKEWTLSESTPVLNRKTQMNV